MAKHLRMGNYGSGYYAYNPIGGCWDIRLILRLRIDDLSENRQREESMASGVSQEYFLPTIVPSLSFNS